MMRLGRLLELARDARGTMAIETAIVAPVLAVMSLGIFEAGSMVSRQQELQSGASEAEAIILAAATSSTPTSSDDLKKVIKNSLGLTDAQVVLTQRFRCDGGDLLEDATTCTSGKALSTYVRVELKDTYTPVWSNYGFGKSFNYNVVRTVLVNTLKVK